MSPLPLPAVYDLKGAGSDRNQVVLSDVHIDIMDYLQGASCTEAEFRQMWAEFEWENKIAVHTNITDLQEYLLHILQATNMKSLTPAKVLYSSSFYLHFISFIILFIRSIYISFAFSPF